MINLNFNPDNHQYKVNDEIVLSVTQVISDLNDFDNIPQKTLENAANRGNEIHAAIEIFNEFGLIEIEEEYRGYIEAYINFQKTFNHEPILNEQRLYSQKYGYAGTVDSYCRVLGIPTVADYKTYAQVDQVTVHKVGLQLAAYRQLLQEEGYEVVQGLLIHLRKDKPAKLYFYTSEQLDDYFQKFVQMLKYKNLIKEIKEGK